MHTKGPLEWSSAGHASGGRIVVDQYFIRVPGDNVSLADDIVDPQTGKPSEANVRRLVACWNALQHVSTERLETGEVLNTTQKLVDAYRTIAALTATKLEALPTDGLVWVCLNADGMPRSGIREHLESLSCVLTKAKAEGKTNAQFILTASLWPGHMQIQALPDEELARIGLMRDYVAKGLRNEALSALEGLVAEAERFGMGNSSDQYAFAQAVIAKARGDA